MAKVQNDTMDKLVALCKGRGFVFPGSEIYGGLANSWDYGPLGVEFKNNVKRAWWKKFVQESKYNVGIDCAILMNRQVWVASGHVGNFNDPLMDCKACKARFRADKLIEDWAKANGQEIEADGWTNEQLESFIEEKQIPCPTCGKHDFTGIRKFNMMFKTHQGVTEDASNEIYLRPETAQGVKEFTLIAQDTTRYGTNNGEESQLPQLIEEIAAIPGVEWLRALYCYPERVDERLLDTMKRLPNVCDYLDLPMQHISQHILTDMNRTDTSAHIREVCRMFKERGMMLRTTLMVGFPGETDEDFNELMDFVKQTKFDRMGAFMFCPEDGTRAAEMPNQIPEEVKQERYDRLMTLQHGISLAQNKARVGTTCRVLVEKKRGSRYVGRSEYEAPETDGSIFFGSDEPCEIGSFVNVKITGAKAYDLMGERI